MTFIGTRLAALRNWITYGRHSLANGRTIWNLRKQCATYSSNLNHCEVPCSLLLKVIFIDVIPLSSTWFVKKFWHEKLGVFNTLHSRNSLPTLLFLVLIITLYARDLLISSLSIKKKSWRKKGYSEFNL